MHLRKGDGEKNHDSLKVDSTKKAVVLYYDHSKSTGGCTQQKREGKKIHKKKLNYVTDFFFRLKSTC